MCYSAFVNATGTDNSLTQLAPHCTMTRNKKITTRQVAKEAEVFQASHALVKAGKLVLRYPESRNHPSQAYRTAEDERKVDAGE